MLITLTKILEIQKKTMLKNIEGIMEERTKNIQNINEMSIENFRNKIFNKKKDKNIYDVRDLFINTF